MASGKADGGNKEFGRVAQKTIESEGTTTMVMIAHLKMIGSAELTCFLSLRITAPSTMNEIINTGEHIHSVRSSNSVR